MRKALNFLRRSARAAAPYALIVVITLGLLDLVLIATGLFPPGSDLGHPTLGWVSVDPTGQMEEWPCYDPDTEVAVGVERNEDGLRTSSSVTELAGSGEHLEIAIGGDSHSDLCYSNEDIHFGVTGSALESDDRDVAVFGYAAGRYSPLQAYLALKEPIRENEPDVLILNLYTGNDFYDMMRVDDRPHFVAEGDGYAVAPPRWFLYDEPDNPKHSRVLYAIGQFYEASGVRGIVTRVLFLRESARDQGVGPISVFRYINDLRKSSSPDIGYSGAFAAQILNQQLFFHRFPDSYDEALKRVEAVLEMVQAENPDMLLVLSPIPSYQLVGERPVDPSFLTVLERLPLDYDAGAAMEQSLFDALPSMADRHGWAFIDNLAPLREYSGSTRLYNDFDYHITTVANRIIGENQADAIDAMLGELPNPEAGAEPVSDETSSLGR